jgi:hypothetical protein
VQWHAATIFAKAEAEDAAGANLPQIVKDEFDAYLACDRFACCFPRLCSAECNHELERLKLRLKGGLTKKFP